MRRSTILLGGLVWLLVVAGASLVTWQVIDAAGRDVLSEQAGAAPATGVTDSPSSSNGQGSGQGTGDGGPTRSPSATATGSPEPAGAAVQVRGWAGAAGSVVVRCTGSRAALQSTIPTVGWGFEVKKRGPEEVEVELRRDDPDGRTRIESVCVGGVPQFAVDADDAGDDGGGQGDGDNSGSGSSGSGSSGSGSSGSGSSGSGSSGSGDGGGGDDNSGSGSSGSG